MARRQRTTVQSTSIHCFCWFVGLARIDPENCGNFVFRRRRKRSKKKDVKDSAKDKLTLRNFYLNALRAGVDPELFWRLSFVEARSCVRSFELRDELNWLRTSHVLALLHNVNAKKEHQRSFEDFNPYQTHRKRHAPPAQIASREIGLFSKWQKHMNNGTERVA